MANQTELMSATAAPLTLPARHSHGYQVWLVIEIGKLAVVLGQQQQLDTDGIRQSSMALDLVNTRPPLMQIVFARCRREKRFLPVTSELLEMYREEVRKADDADKAQRQAENDAQIQAMKGDRDSYVTFGETVLSLPTVAEKIAANRREQERREVPPPRTLETQTDECPHCGRTIPFTTSALMLLTASDLRSIADRKDLKQAEMIAAREGVTAQAKTLEADSLKGRKQFKRDATKLKRSTQK